MTISQGVFFSFFLIFIFQAVRRVKRQKIAQKEKYQSHLSRTIFQEQYSIWSWFLVHLCKMMISPCIFSFYKIFIFWGCYRGKREKHCPKWKTTITSVTCHYLKKVCTAYDHDSWYTYVKWWYLQGFFHFFEIFIFQAFRGIKGQKVVGNEK